MSQPLDFLGSPIDVGDTVVWSDAGGRGGSMMLHKSMIIRMTDKQALVHEDRWSKWWRPFMNVVVVTKGGIGQ